MHIAFNLSWSEFRNIRISRAAEVSHADATGSWWICNIAITLQLLSISRIMALFSFVLQCVLYIVPVSWPSLALFFLPTDILSTAEPGSAQGNLAAFITLCGSLLIASSASSLCARSHFKLIFVHSWRHDAFFLLSDSYIIILASTVFSIVISSTVYFFVCITSFSLIYSC